MKTPFVSRSRSIKTSSGDLARYVPAFDGQIRFTNEVQDSIIWVAEGAHRFVSLSTNIGAVDFGLEATAAQLTQLLRTKEFLHSPAEILQLIIWLKNLHSVLEQLFASYEALDECWSAFVLYLNFMREGRDSEADALEKNLEAYEKPSISRRFQELKQIRNGPWGTELNEKEANTTAIIKGARIAFVVNSCSEHSAQRIY